MVGIAQHNYRLKYFYLFFHFGMVFALLSCKALKHPNVDSLKEQWVTSVGTVSL